jgi:hypothetical protein
MVARVTSIAIARRISRHKRPGPRSTQRTATTHIAPADGSRGENVMFAPSTARSANADHEEVSRIVRLSSLVAPLKQAQVERFLGRLDTWAAFAVVVLASSATLCAAVAMLERWQLS